MDQISPRWERRRVPPVEPELLASALFVFSEYLAQVAAEEQATREPDEEEAELPEDGLPVDTRAVLDRLADDLGTDPKTTLTLYIRLTALFRLLSSTPSLSSIATNPDDGELTPQAIAAGASLELYPDPASDAPGDFDPREFREALDED
jgi:hypothetical protein